MGIAGAPFMSYTDVPAALSGLTTIMLAFIQKQKLGPDEYQQVFEDAFGLPTLLAKKFADDIESYDKIVADANADGKIAISEGLQLISQTLQEGARRLTNGLSDVLGIGTILNWDQSQVYDVDALDEIVRMGEVVAGMRRRNRLMAGQALLSAQMGVFRVGTGDAEEGDAEMGDAASGLLGNILSKLGRKRLPAALLGPGTTALTERAARANVETGKALLNEAGMSATKAGVSNTHAPTKRGSILKSALKSVLSMNPTVAVVKGAAGLMRKKDPKRNLGDALYGDPANGKNDQLYGQVRDEFGSSIADAWKMGDVEGMMGEVLAEFGDADSDILETADRDLVEQAGEAIDDAYGEIIDSMSPEMGGVYKRALTRKAVAKGLQKDAKDQRQMLKVSSKIMAKNSAAQMRADARQPGSNPLASAGLRRPTPPRPTALAYEEEAPTQEAPEATEYVNDSWGQQQPSASDGEWSDSVPTEVNPDVQAFNMPAEPDQY
jgi:hypothetical protein